MGGERVTVVVPTYRRPAGLLRALASLQEQTLAEFSILVVDNAADPAVERAVAEFNREVRVPARYLAEPVPGLHSARNRSLLEAPDGIMAFTDDDATFDPRWLEMILARFEEVPQAAVVGGPVRVRWDVQPPEWLVRQVEGRESMPILSLMEPPPDCGPGPDVPIYGVNMVLRREAALAVGGFNPDSFGAIWLGDGESGFLRKLAEAGHVLAHAPDAVVYHHIPPERMTPAYFRRRMANQGAADAYRDFHRAMPGALKLLRHAGGLTLRNWRTWLAALACRNHTDDAALRTQMDAAASFERLRYVLRLLTDPGLRRLVRRTDWMNAAAGPHNGEARQ